MVITDTLNGQTVEDVRRNPDGSVTFCCDSGRTLTLFVRNGKIEAQPRKIILPDQFIPEVVSERMRLLEAFQGYQVNYVTHAPNGCLMFVCEPLRSYAMYQKSCGHREIRLTHKNGLIGDLPPVSALIELKGQKVFGKTG